MSMVSQSILRKSGGVRTLAAGAGGGTGVPGELALAAGTGFAAGPLGLFFGVSICCVSRLNCFFA